MKTGLELIIEERQRQVESEGWTAEHDDQHVAGEMAKAAVCYTMPERDRVFSVKERGFKITVSPEWSWDANWWKPTPEDRVRELTKAGALISAEIDRLNRLEAKSK